jgi:hypothetical protein
MEFLYIVFLVLLALFFSRAAKKAGFSPWWVLLGAVPILNIVLLWVFAYARWPTAPGENAHPEESDTL